MGYSTLPWQSTRWLWIATVGATLSLGLLLTSLYSYLLFHCLVEIFSAVVAFSMFIVFWNARRFLHDSWLVILCVGFSCAGILDLVHMLAFKGMGVFPNGANLATQLWVAARYVQSITLLSALLVRGNRIRPGGAILVFGAVTVSLLGAIFSGRFPACFAPVTGPTVFKVASEFAVCAIFAAALVVLHRRRNQFSREVYSLLMLAIVTSIGSELTFTFYHSVFDMLNALGHLLKVFAAYLVYKVFVEQGLRQPYSLLFQDLAQREEALRSSEDEMRIITNSVPALISYLDSDYYYRFANKGYEEWFGRPGLSIVGSQVRDVLGEDVFEEVRPYLERALRGEQVTFTRRLRLSSGPRTVHGTYVPRFDDRGRVLGLFALVHDITDRVRMEEALSKSEAEYRAIFDLAGSGTAQSEVETGRFIRVNRKFCEITGYSEEELLQRSFSDITHPEDRERDRSLFFSVVRGVEPGWHSEKRYVRKDGEVIWVEVTGAVIRDEDGVPLHTVAVVNDITVRKHFEQALAESEQRFRLAIEHAGITVSNQDRNLCFTWSYNTILANPEELLGKDDRALLAPEEAERVMALKRRVMETGQGTRAIVQAELRGEAKVFDIKVEAMRDASGAIAGVMTAGFDITAQKRTEHELRTLTQTLEERVAARTAELQQSGQALRQSEERLNLALASADMGVWDQNPEDGTINLDKFTAHLYGLSAVESPVSAERLMSRIHPEDLERVEWDVMQTLTKGTQFDTEFRVVWPDGSVHHLASRGRVYLAADGVPTRMSGVTWDVTERMRLQDALRQSERLAAVGQMISGLSHESRNALQRNRACIEILTRRLKDNPQALSILEEAAKAQADLQRVHDEVRDYSGPMKLDVASYKLEDIWTEAWRYLEPQRQEKASQLTEHIESSSTICLVDPFRIRQVFRNLLENALAAATAPVEIHISCRDTELDGRPARQVVVRDNGPGLNPEQAEHIFEPFYTTKSKGTGLGMAIVKRIVESHQGRIEIDPRPGEGLQVTLILPHA